ncbi:hypothetical protein DL98DRAFT_600497 [Cadophora sp. DSE1049]|nr:hypothetical protein DL98DRAFT_600497 [Cadophora sp. DSE1049]
MPRISNSSQHALRYIIEITAFLVLIPEKHIDIVQPRPGWDLKPVAELKMGSLRVGTIWYTGLVCRDECKDCLHGSRGLWEIPYV